MNTFTVYPAIDLRSGDVVRLEQGQKERIKRFDFLPAQAAQHWIDQGADWLHVVNLDGAFGEDSQPNLAELEKIIEAAKPGASVQFGGGLRSIESIRSILSMGVKRVIIGTAAVEEPNLVVDALANFGPESVVLGVDASDGFVQIARVSHSLVMLRASKCAIWSSLNSKSANPRARPIRRTDAFRDWWYPPGTSKTPSMSNKSIFRVILFLYAAWQVLRLPGLKLCLYKTAAPTNDRSGQPILQQAAAGPHLLRQR